jgi:DNA-binding NarL/FixJ family response regulator
MKHLLTLAPEVQLVSSPDDRDSLTQQAKRLQPDLVITNARKLGEGARAHALLADTRRVSPRSRIILTYFDTRIAATNDAAVDEYLEEELIVKRLIPAVRRVSSLTPSAKSAKRRTAFTNLSRRRKVG